MNVWKRLFSSRKFVVSLTGMIVMIAVSLGLDEGKAKDAADNVVVMISILVAAIAAEDVARGLKKTEGAKDDGEASAWNRGSDRPPLIFAAIVMAGLLLVGGGCATWTPLPNYVAADRETYDVIAPAHTAYVVADPALDEDQKARRLRVLDTWRMRVEAEERLNPPAIQPAPAAMSPQDE